jgi:predicted acyltransferase
MILGNILTTVAGLALFVCLIMVLIKMFKTQESPLMGILGIITCGLWAFIWGWMNAGKYNLTKIMLIWTTSYVLIGVGVGLVFKAGLEMAKEQGIDFSNPNLSQPMELTPAPAEVAPEEPVEESAPEQ